MPTLLLFGAVVQTGITLVLPARYSLIPLLLISLHTIASTIIEIQSPSAWKKGHGAGIILSKVSAQFPKESYNDDNDNSPFSSTPANHGIVVLHLGIRFNHPLGLLSPGSKEIAKVSAACNKRVMAYIDDDKTESKDDFGCLGMTSWQGTERESNNTVLNIYYFRDIEGLNRFAHDEIHRKAWDYYNKEFCARLGYTHIGVFHEAFYAPPEMYESIYLNIQPTMLGLATMQVFNEAKGKREWVSPLVDGKHPRLKSQWSRMGRKVVGDDAKGGEGDGH